MPSTSLQVGDAIPEYVHTTGPIEWARYAAVNGIFNDIHHDDDAGRAAGNPTGAFGQGNLIWSYAFNMLRNWAGLEARVTAAGGQFRGMNQKGDIVRCTGTVTAIVEGEAGTEVTLAMEAKNQHGAVLLTGTATVEL